jgi:hypothetical protein
MAPFKILSGKFKGASQRLCNTCTAKATPRASGGPSPFVRQRSAEAGENITTGGVCERVSQRSSRDAGA